MIREANKVADTKKGMTKKTTAKKQTSESWTSEYLKKWGDQIQEREKESRINQQKIMTDHKSGFGKQKKMANKTIRAKLLEDIENMPAIPHWVEPIDVNTLKEFSSLTLGLS